VTDPRVVRTALGDPVDTGSSQHERVEEGHDPRA
jgi:hypothetical protein